jgi:hypothetical protein
MLNYIRTNQGEYMSNELIIQEALINLSTDYLILFPNGYSTTSYREMFKSGTLRVGLISNQNDCSSNIRDNDTGYGVFSINYSDGEFTLGFETVPFRKIKAKSVEELQVKFKKYLEKFYTMVGPQLSAQNIYQQSSIKEEYFSCFL